MRYLWIQMFCKGWYEQTLLNWFMKRKSHLNVTFVITAYIKEWREIARFKTVHGGYKSFNATFVTTDVLEKTLWMHMLHLFMNEKSNSYTSLVHERKKPLKCDYGFYRRVTWYSMLKQFMMNTNHLNARFVTTNFLKKTLWMQLFMK